MNRICVLVMVWIVLFAGCRKRASDEIDFGAVENSTYRNDYFGLSVKLPSEWSVQDKETQQKLMDLGRKMVEGDDKNLKAVIKASEMQTVNLFAAFKHPIGTPVPYNPNIMCLAERVSHMPGIKRGKDYHFHSKRLLELSQVEVSFPKEVSTEELGGHDFDVMYVESLITGMTIRQKHYATIMKGYALVFAVSFTNGEEESTLDNVLSSVTFE